MNHLLFINFFGGLALFLYALKIMNDNLQAVAGNKMKQILKKLTDTPIKGVAVGIVVTGIIQSSSATSVMLIGLVNANLMNLAQAIGVIMGANIGTTVTAQLIAFNLGNFAYIFVIAGIVMLFTRQNKTMEKWSYIILGFGLLFISLDVMSSSTVDLKDSPLASSFLTYMSYNPWLAIIAGAIFTMIIQSSSASIGIILVLARTGALSDIESAMYLVYGGNIGTTVKAWFASINVSKTAKRVALVHTLFNIIGSIIFTLLTYFGLYQRFIILVTPYDINNPENITHFIANTHTYFNILCCFMFLPFVNYLAKLAEYVIKDDHKENLSTGDAKHLDYNLLKTAEIAVEQSIKEMQEMIRLVKNSLETSMELFNTNNYRDLENVEKIENAIDYLQQEITLYLVAINDKSNSKMISQKIPSLLHTVNDIERIGDYSENINIILNTQILSQKASYSDEFMSIIYDKHNKILYMLDLLINYLDDFDNDIYNKINELEDRLHHEHKDIRIKILEMIKSSECEAMEGLHTIDYIDAIDSITAKIKNVIFAGSHQFIYIPVDNIK